jgi:N-acetylglucosaminyldiphosphoundecaprenol N-acetyl-beta-D-mannosaminyltransferase
MKKKTILGASISTGSYENFIDEIFSLVEAKVPSYVCFANVHMIVEAYKNRSFRKILNNATVAAPDGKPLSVFLRLSEGLKQPRVCGMDLLPDILKKAEACQKSVYFYGTTNDLLQTIEKKAHAEFPNLKIAGYYSPPFRELSDEETSHITDMIKKAAPDLVFVSLGCPKQEKWMAANKDSLGACLLGLGQAFKVYAGEEKRLPKWMRELSLEWAYRFYLEPRRLWKRYLYTNSLFLFLGVKDLVRLWLQPFSPQLSRTAVLNHQLNRLENRPSFSMKSPASAHT